MVLADSAESTRTPILEARGLSAGYGSVSAIQGIDIAVRPGEMIALLGANGAGKTTTLLTLAGVIKQTAGEVRVDGVATRAPLHHRARLGLGLIVEGRSVFTQLSTRDNLRVGSGAIGDALDLFPELKPLLGRRAGLLSGGEQQMLSMARALIERPRVLLTDELSLGLAPLIVKRLLEILRRVADAGSGVLITEQHAALALSICDRAYVLQRGRLVLESTGQDLLNRLEVVQHTYWS
jgi:ABC-type branched-subunit amino acid transport system ATPase component